MYAHSLGCIFGACSYEHLSADSPKVVTIKNSPIEFYCTSSNWKCCIIVMRITVLKDRAKKFCNCSFDLQYQILCSSKCCKHQIPLMEDENSNIYEWLDEEKGSFTPMFLPGRVLHLQPSQVNRWAFKNR